MPALPGVRAPGVPTAVLERALLGGRGVVGNAMRTLTAAIALGTLFVVTGCGSGGGDSPAAVGTPGTTSSASGPVDPAPEPSLPTSEQLASRLITHLMQQQIGVVAGLVQDADTDPNHLMGRPGGYVGRASFDLPGGDEQADPGTIDRGGVLEVFATEADARRRADYIRGIAQGAPELAGEFDTVHGVVLLRVVGKVSPTVAKRVDAGVVKALAAVG